MKNFSRSLMAILILSAPILTGADGACDGTPAATGDAGNGDAGLGTCAPQHAEAEGPCRLALGYKWDGARCVALGGCRCVGADCANLFSSPEECDIAHAQCGPAPKCSKEVAAVSGFVQANKACQTSDDCQTSPVGCGYTEDGCTGAVYVNRDTNLTVLRELARELYRCDHGGDARGACLRVIRSAACVSGACQRATP